MWLPDTVDRLRPITPNDLLNWSLGSALPRVRGGRECRARAAPDGLCREVGLVIFFLGRGFHGLGGRHCDVIFPSVWVFL